VKRYTYTLPIESVALDTVKTAVAMGFTVWCERGPDGWTITVER